jgi:hypothetical protein
MVAIPNAPRLSDMPKSEPVPEGIYHLRLDKADYKLSSKKQESMVEVHFSIFGPEEAEQYHGRKVFENIMLAGPGMFRLRQLLEATGEDENFVLEDTEALIGREVAAVVQVEPARQDPENPGKEFSARNKIARFLPIR